MYTGRPAGLFRDRRDAGECLARLLRGYRECSDVLVLGLPRGGVPVAARVAEALGAPLDVVVVRKLGVPGFEELAMGAIASGGVRLLNHEVVRELRISKAAIDTVAAREAVELERRERAYRGDRPTIDAAGRTVILVDDGLATGSTMRAAVAAMREREAARVIVAVPVAPVSTCRELEPLVDRLVCAVRADDFLSVSHWYEDFTQISDEEVRSLLRDGGRAAGPAAHGHGPRPVSTPVLR
jgi:predicted phosphoribosyltransferase